MSNKQTRRDNSLDHDDHLSPINATNKQKKTKPDRSTSELSSDEESAEKSPRRPYERRSSNPKSNSPKIGTSENKQDPDNRKRGNSKSIKQVDDRSKEKLQLPLNEQQPRLQTHTKSPGSDVKAKTTNKQKQKEEPIYHTGDSSDEYSGDISPYPTSEERPSRIKVKTPSQTKAKTPSKTSRSEVKETRSLPRPREWWENYWPFKKASSNIKEASSADARGHWNNKKEYLLSCIGATVGLGNFWRFPSLVYKNGGGAFFIPYVLLQILVGTPVFFMELSLGQFIAKGPTGVFYCNPTAKGLGLTMALVASCVSIYYNVLLSYGVFYFFSSMNPVHPWSICKQEWFKDNCTSGYGPSIPVCKNESYHNKNITYFCQCTGVPEKDFNMDTCKIKENYIFTYPKLMKLSEQCRDAIKCTNITKPAAHFYFSKEVLAVSESISDIGTPHKSLVFCLYFMWILVTFSLYRGVKTSGKLVYFTVIYALVLMVILVIYQFTIEGSALGIKYLLVPTWSKLKEMDVWKDAAGQICFSLNLGMGINIMLGSYSRFHSNVLVDTLIVTNADMLASFLSSLLVFTTLGSLTHRSGSKLEDSQIAGPGLVFVTYPEAFLHLPGSNFWCIAFFLMLLALGFHSLLAVVQTSMTTIMDEYPILYRYKWKVATGLCACLFLLGVPLLCPGGIYILSLLDKFCANLPTMVIAFGEVVAVAGIYGVNNFLADVEYMIGYPPPPQAFWKYTLAFVSPVFLLTLLTLTIAFSPRVLYDDGRPYEIWAQVTGWCLFLSVIAPIPFVCAWKIYYAEGDTVIEKMQHASEPSLKWIAQGQAMKTSI